MLSFSCNLTIYLSLSHVIEPGPDLAVRPQNDSIAKNKLIEITSFLLEGRPLTPFVTPQR